MKPPLKKHHALRVALLAFFCMLFFICDAQRKKVSDYLTVNGYIKYLGSFNFVDNIGSLTPSTLLHNRINLKIRPVSQFTIGAEFRTRLLISDQQKLYPGFGKLYAQDNGIVNLSFLWVDKAPMVFNTMIDRLYMDWREARWDIRIGRQRLNWGMNLTWNPNDIFNTYNFLDFDYEERPGSDAIRGQYNLTSFSNLELAFSPARDKYKMIGAIKYVMNTHNYDIQFLAGNYQRDVVVGIGWAGSIKDVGFKGEASYFQDWNDTKFRSIAVSSSVSFDYAFKKGWYLNASLLYNNKAGNSLYSAGQLLSDNLSPKALMPAKFNFLVQTSKQFTPVTSGSMVVIYSPQLNLLILSPNVSYSIATNWDLDIITQSFFSDDPQKKFKVLGNSVNARLRWSFSN
jgi:hypothetical protein